MTQSAPCGILTVVGVNQVSPTIPLGWFVQLSSLGVPRNRSLSHINQGYDLPVMQVIMG
jgi:hypothetical protein